MTRETKIGLLVGLAFIIVIGILLSDQLMRSTEPPPAPLASVADTLRKGTATPAPTRAPVAQVQPQQDVTPDNTVPTRDEITRRPPPVTFLPGAGAGTSVQVGPGTGASAQAGNANPGQAQAPTAPAGQAGRAIGLIGTDSPNNTAAPIRGQRGDGTAGRSIADVAAAIGETLVGPDGQPLRASQPLQPISQQPQTPGTSTARPRQAAAGSARQYVAEPGDSLSRIAARLMGANTKANRDAIVRANPQLEADPNKIIVGQTYNIPAPGGQGAQAQTPPAAQRGAAPTAERTERTPAPVKAAGAEFWYEVRPGDSLWKIAKQQLGDAGTVPAIKELNKDIVKNWDVLPAGTRLRMPARPIASAQ
ncbi:MAG TPA: LysM peptidoglycan-binding domain-containing protein [Tepidisphaeraceae bacterium]|jgi:nucleoid-associated protein YgaU